MIYDCLCLCRCTKSFPIMIVVSLRKQVIVAIFSYRLDTWRLTVAKVVSRGRGVVQGQGCCAGAGVLIFKMIKKAACICSFLCLESSNALVSKFPEPLPPHSTRAATQHWQMRQQKKARASQKKPPYGRRKELAQKCCLRNLCLTFIVFVLFSFSSCRPSFFAKKRYQNLYISYILYIFAVENK